jgi:selT/selW/selH-like putative selenoprotein
VEADLKGSFPGIEVELVGGHQGIFDVFADGRLVFSKHEQHRFPDDGEVVDAMKG